MYDVALISALYGDYDTFRHPVRQTGNVQYICLIGGSGGKPC